MGFLKWITAWTLLIVITIATSRTTPGGKIVSYILWLMIILILVTRYKQIASLFQVSPGSTESILTIGQY